MKKRIVYIFSYLLISIRIVVLLFTECTNLSIIDLRLQYLFNILIIVVLSYIVLRYRNKKKIFLILIIILTLNTMYDVFLDLLFERTKKMYFKSSTREVVLLVEVDKEKNIYVEGSLVDEATDEEVDKFYNQLYTDIKEDDDYDDQTVINDIL